MWASCDHRSQGQGQTPAPSLATTATATHAVVHSHTVTHVIQLAPRTCFCEDAGFRLYWHFFSSTATHDIHAHTHKSRALHSHHCVACAVVLVSEFAFVLASGVLSSLVLLCVHMYLYAKLHCLFVHGLVFFVALAVLVIFVPVHFLILLCALPLVLLYLLSHVHLFFVVDSYVHVLLSSSVDLCVLGCAIVCLHVL